MPSIESLYSTPSLTPLGSAGRPKNGPLARLSAESREHSQYGRPLAVRRNSQSRPSTLDFLTPMPDYLKPIEKSAPCRWNKLHEDHMMEKLQKKRSTRKKDNLVIREGAKKIVKTLPFEILAKDWLSDQQATVETRAFLVDRVLPTLILGIEKLLVEVDKRHLAETVESDRNFNPINFLAQYLMRNNPLYSNFSEASSYIRGLREITEGLRQELFEVDENKLVKIKGEAKRRREAREWQEHLAEVERQRRAAATAQQFVEWNVGLYPDGRVELALLQNALRSFMEMAEKFPDELQTATKYGSEMDATDNTGKTMTLNEYSQYLNRFIADLPSELFDQFVQHLSQCATDFRRHTENEQRRVLLTHLFVSCDHTGVGLLDRHRVLNLFELFYDKAKEDLQCQLRNPRKWPVVEILEADDNFYVDEEMLVEDEETAEKTAEQEAAAEVGEGGEKPSTDELVAVEDGLGEDGVHPTEGEVDQPEEGDKGEAGVTEEAMETVEKPEEQGDAPAPAEEEGKDVEGTRVMSSAEQGRDSQLAVEMEAKESLAKESAEASATESKEASDAQLAAQASETSQKPEFSTSQIIITPGEQTPEEDGGLKQVASENITTTPAELTPAASEMLSASAYSKESLSATSKDEMDASESPTAASSAGSKRPGDSTNAEDMKTDTMPGQQDSQKSVVSGASTDEDNVDAQEKGISFALSDTSAVAAASVEDMGAELEKGRSLVTQQSKVSFADGTTFEKDRNQLASRSQSRLSAFDEAILNLPQFVQLTETFLGDVPDKQTISHLVAYVSDGYVETEDERLQRIIKVRREEELVKRRAQLNNLFEIWDNDGSGYLDLDEVGTILKKYKEGNENEAILKAKAELNSGSKRYDCRLTKREFKDFIFNVVEKMSGTDTFDYLHEYLLSSVERSYAERIRGEARKKWLQLITSAAETSGANMEPVYTLVFQALYKDAEAHGDCKNISANIAMLEQNTVAPERGDNLLLYVACTPNDAPFLLGRALFKDMKGISFASVASGKPIHVPKVANHGNIHFWNQSRAPSERDGSFIVVPLKDRNKRVFGLLGVDTLNDAFKRSIFITHEINFYQGVAKAFSIAFHHVDMRQKMMRIGESAISWIRRRSPHVVEVTVYMVEPDKANGSFVLRRMMHTDAKGRAVVFKDPARLERNDNLFRDYLFKCVDNSESTTADAYGERHLAVPLRDDKGWAIVVVDVSMGEEKELPRTESYEVMKMLKLLQMAYREISQEANLGEKMFMLEGERHSDETRTNILFDRLMLMELRDSVAKLDSKAYAELKSYKEPPVIIHLILKSVLAVFYHKMALEGCFDDWKVCKQYVKLALTQQIIDFDPTSDEPADSEVPVDLINSYLSDVPHGTVLKHGSRPAQYLYNWVFVCISLIEHTCKMRAGRPKVITDAEPTVSKQSKDTLKTTTTQQSEKPLSGEGDEEEMDSTSIMDQTKPATEAGTISETAITGVELTGAVTESVLNTAEQTSLAGTEPMGAESSLHDVQEPSTEN